MARYHDTGTICTANKRACPLGLGDGDHIEADSRQEFEQKLAEKMSGTTATVTASKSFPAPTKEGIETYDSFKDRWNRRWEAIYQESPGWNPMQDKGRIEALANRDKPGTYDGAWVPNRPDGGVEIPKGEYVYISSDGTGPDDETNPEFAKAYGKWMEQAYADTPPGTVTGAYLDGEPCYFLSATDMGTNHGYDGEYLVPRNIYDKFRKEKVVGGGPNAYPATPVTIKENTVLYGYRGNPNEIPLAYADDGASSEPMKGLTNEEKEKHGEIMDDIYGLNEGGHQRVPGTLFNNKEIDYRVNENLSKE